MAPFHWGVLGTGFIARKFTLGLRASDRSTVTAVGSRTAAKAERFAAELEVGHAHGSYEALVADPDVDAIYVATPPSLHREHALLALAAGKHVLVEKPFALDADEAREVQSAAAAAERFCMEGMWTRFLPLIVRAKTMVDRGELGQVRMLSGSFCAAEAVQPSNHHFDPALGGGALLDRGVYPLSLAFHLLGEPARIVSESVVGETGVDEDVAALLRYDSGALAVIKASLRTQAPNDLVIMGDRGQLHIDGPIFRPSKMAFTPVHAQVRGDGDAGGNPKVEAVRESHRFHDAYQRFGGLAAPLLHRSRRHITERYAGNGYHYEADEVARCVRAGLMESPVMPMSETVAVMAAVDTIRGQRTEAST